MNEDIKKAFEGRWRYKRPSMTIREDCEEVIKELCFDFFEAAWLLSHTEDVEITDTDFEVWWNLYQKKRGKEKCQKKWAKLSQKDRQACIAATPAYVQSTPDKQYRKDPQTFLNNKSWEDEIIIRDSKDQQRSQRLAEAANLVAKYTGADKGTKG